MTEYLPEGSRLHNPENIAAIRTPKGLQEAIQKRTILEAFASVCDSNHNLIVDLPCMKGIIPRIEGAMGIAEGTTRDIALIARAGKPVCFRVLRIEIDSNGNPAKVTHMERFGCFVDIGCGIPSLIPIDAISVSRISHPSDRFHVGQSIRVIIKSIAGQRICLSHKELLGTWEENASMFSAGETVAGIIRSVESYGVFIELAPNLAGLAEPKTQVSPGQYASVYIKALIPEKLKVKLIIVDIFEKEMPDKPLLYFIKDSHISHWKYTPDNSSKIIETNFS